MLREKFSGFAMQVLAIFIIVSIGFVIAEPTIGLAVGDSQFTVSQTITKEVSFTVPATNVTMGPSLGGLTGGTANGLVQVAVATNSLTGYQMTLMASTSAGMQGTASTTNYIPAYVTSGANGTPDYTFAVATNKAGFGYTVEASTTTDVAQTFRYSGSTCNSGTDHAGTSQCWLGATTTPVTVINRNLPTAYTGASSTIRFRVGISANPNPVIPNDTYVATETLTATVN